MNETSILLLILLVDLVFILGISYIWLKLKFINRTLSRRYINDIEAGLINRTLSRIINDIEAGLHIEFNQFEPYTRPLQDQQINQFEPNTRPLQDQQINQFEPNTRPLQDQQINQFEPNTRPLQDQQINQFEPNTRPLQDQQINQFEPNTRPLQDQQINQFEPNTRPLQDQQINQFEPNTRPLQDQQINQFEPYTSPLQHQQINQFEPYTSPLQHQQNTVDQLHYRNRNHACDLPVETSTIQSQTVCPKMEFTKMCQIDIVLEPESDGNNFSEVLARVMNERSILTTQLRKEQRYNSDLKASYESLLQRIRQLNRNENLNMERIEWLEYRESELELIGSNLKSKMEKLTRENEFLNSAIDKEFETKHNAENKRLRNQLNDRETACAELASKYDELLETISERDSQTEVIEILNTENQKLLKENDRLMQQDLLRIVNEVDVEQPKIHKFHRAKNKKRSSTSGQLEPQSTNQQNACIDKRIELLREKAKTCTGSDKSLKLNNRAAALALYKNNRQRDIQALDLHLLHKAEALDQFEQRFLLLTDLGLQKLEVITGIGKHSSDGVAKLKPYVQEYIERENITREEHPDPKNLGSLIVSVPIVDQNTI